MAPTLAPEAAGGTAALAYMALTLVALLAYLISRGLLAAWSVSFGFMLNWLADNLTFKIGAFGVAKKIDLGYPFREVDRLVIKALQTAAANAEQEVGYFWHGTATIAEWTAGQVAGLAHDTADAFDWLLNQHIPKWAKYAIAPSLLIPLVAKLVLHQVQAHWPTLTKTITTYVHEVPTVVNKVVHAAGAIPIPTPWVIPHFQDWWHDITRWRHRVTARLARLEKLLAAAGLAAAMANVLGIPSGKCLRGGPIGKVARRLCGMSSRALNDVLGLLADVLILTNICTIITLLERGLALVQPAITAFITGAEAVACYGDNARPPAMPALALDLAAPVGALTLDLP